MARLRREWFAPAHWGIVLAAATAAGGCVVPVEFGDDRGPDGAALVGYWKLDEASGAAAADASGLHNDGNYEGGPVPSALAAPLLFANPYSLAFDQTFEEDVSVPASPSLGVSGPLTLAAWIRPTGATTTQQGIIEKWDTDTSGPAPVVARGYELRIAQEGTLRLVLLAEPGRRANLTGTTAIAVDVWTHVAGTFDGATLRVFINGVEDATMTSTVAPTSGSSPLHIGRDYGVNGFEGNIDEARVYRRALGADEVGALAHGEDLPN